MGTRPLDNKQPELLSTYNMIYMYTVYILGLQGMFILRTKIYNFVMSLKNNKILYHADFGGFFYNILLYLAQNKQRTIVTCDIYVNCHMCRLLFINIQDGRLWSAI